jgi:hypothetical protein
VGGSSGGGSSGGNSGSSGGEVSDGGSTESGGLDASDSGAGDSGSVDAADSGRDASPLCRGACPGCCDPVNHMCRVGGLDTSCGRNGATCQDCTATAMRCENGACN